MTLAGGAGVAQLIPILIAPVLTRFYSPDDFGSLALIISITNIMIIMCTGKLESAIMLPASRMEAFWIAFTAQVMTISTSAIALLYVCLDFLLDGPLYEGVGPILFLIPFLIYFLGVFQPLSFLSLRNKGFKMMSWSSLVASANNSIISLLLGVFTASSGLVWGKLFGSIASFVVLVRSLRNGIIVSFRQFNFTKFKDILRKYKEFPIYVVPTTLMNMGIIEFFVILISIIYSKEEVGLFALARRMVFLPITVIGKSISQAYHQRLSVALIKGESIIKIFRSTVKMLFYIAAPISILIYFLSPIVFSLIFGEEWAISGKIASVLSLAFLMKFVVTPVTPIFSMSGNIRLGAKWKTTYFVSSVCFFAVAYFYKMELMTFLVIYTVHEALLYSWYLLLCFKASKNYKLI
jgi:O-antigen/teichoic acid export membrane protein